MNLWPLSEKRAGTSRGTSEGCSSMRRLGPSSAAVRIVRHLIRINAGDVGPNGLELVATAEHEAR